ncbi:Hypothetical protein Cp106_1707 [Corynebacterium pseudotuberculosis 1/06-A]|nr:Hypothetical protein Cp106_1707 [Corynebacterium pseudotuberculosis 1/06-A]
MSLPVEGGDSQCSRLCLNESPFVL